MLQATKKTLFIISLCMTFLATESMAYKDTPRKAPISLEELELLKSTVLLGDEDLKYLRLSKEVLEPKVEELLDTWYGFVGTNPHLLRYFSHKGEPNGHYLQEVRKRFRQWVLDTADAQYDQKWLNYQIEIGRRHHRVKKNKTDQVKAAKHIHFRYLIALNYPITATIKPFLEKSQYDKETVEKMHQAWIKSVLLQTILWSHPYVKKGDF